MDQIAHGRPRCSNDDVALKSFFLGPQAENKDWVQYQVFHIFKSYFEWRMKVHPEDGRAISGGDQAVHEFKAQQDHTEELLTNLARRFEGEIPKFSPRYIGHMFSEISLPALFGHILTVLHNPNNISMESAKVGVEIENEALQALAVMVGFEKPYGHFTSGGTVANFEMLFRARARVQELHGSSRDAVLMVPAHKHYSWTKGAFVFGVENLWTIPLDETGHLDLVELEKLIDRANSEKKPILGVVSVAGTTEMGLLDPIHKVADLLDRKTSLGNEIWHHIDAAYGAFVGVVWTLLIFPWTVRLVLGPHRLGMAGYLVASLHASAAAGLVTAATFCVWDVARQLMEHDASNLLALMAGGVATMLFSLSAQAAYTISVLWSGLGLTFRETLAASLVSVVLLVVSTLVLGLPTLLLMRVLVEAVLTPS